MEGNHMAAADEQRLIQELQRLAGTAQWEIITTDRSGPTIRVVLEHVKPTEAQTLVR
jgi:hypothetical protein